jgi:hypothetical protein
MEINHDFIKEEYGAKEMWLFVQTREALATLPLPRPLPELDEAAIEAAFVDNVFS